MSLETKPRKHQIHREILPNGIILLIVENQAADLVSGRFFFSNAGSIVESPDRAGISNLVSSVITKGTRNLSALEIAEQVESVGAGLGADSSTDYFALSLKTVSTDFPAMLKLIGEIIQFPTFPPAEVELERKIALQTIRSQKEQPFNVAFSQLRENIYGQHPYGVSILGKEDSVAKLTAEDLKQYHQTYFRPDHLIISLSGRLTKQKAINSITEIFGNWPIPDTTLTVEQLPAIDTEFSEKITFQDTQQSIVMLGYKGVGVTEEAYPILKLISTYLGNGLSSRLFVELREKRGLAYDVSAFYPTRLEPAPFVVYMGTAPENTEIAIDGLRQEVERLSQIKLSEAELQGAKNKLLGQYALGKQTNGEIAQIYGWYESLGLGVDFDFEFPEAISQVTPEMIQEVANTYLTNPFISIVRPE
ncbi:putative Zn-dependent peptidase [Hyella patelloides LEGE 07179]|uniref:Putative Zn-dependent peptidase n=1 Tax=Hyella patelloides LEGE 07179 TaxID=945734 RepID=A0A563VQI3_9CYAN|nr:pitrilysin family protein [Hyella patelloides]VEP13660.1 putative Zn-dependent peptidase [Hyella patelloides LEGE 07179]